MKVWISYTGHDWEILKCLSHDLVKSNFLNEQAARDHCIVMGYIECHPQGYPK